MKPEGEATPTEEKESELSLSGPAMIDLLQSTLARGGPLSFRASGFSMSPFIRDGDVITVSALSDRSPGLGEVVAFLQQGIEKLAIHRVVWKTMGAYLIKGDNSPGVDRPVPRANILGVVKRVERNGKRVYLGTGPERLLLAYLSRSGWMIPLVRAAIKLLHPFRNGLGSRS